MASKSGIINTLLETLYNCPEAVRDAIRYSLINFGHEVPQLLLNSLYNFLVRTNSPMQISNDALICIYHAAEDIFFEEGDRLEDMSIIEQWATLSKDLLTMSSVDDRMEDVAAELLVTLVGKRIHHDFIMKELLSTFPVDADPPALIISTLCLISATPNVSCVYYKDILSKIAPNIYSIKNEDLQTRLIMLFKKIAQGLLEVDSDTTSTFKLNLVEHQDDLSLIYERLLYTWFKTGSINMKNSIIEALGYLSSLISDEKLKEYCTPTIHAILGCYKRNPNPFLLSSSLAIFCESLVQKGAEETLKCHVENILATLIKQACATIDYNDIVTVKNYSEILRCYEILARNFPENVISQVLQRLDIGCHGQRSGALAVLKHLINSKRISEVFMKRVFSHLNLLLIDDNSKVIKNMSQLILCLSSNGLLSQENGGPFIAYLIQHAAGGQLEPKGRIDLSEVCNEPAKDVCCESLILMGTMQWTVPILWPHMLQYLIISEYENSLPVILKCLANLTSLEETKPHGETTNVFDQLSPPVLSEAVIVKLLTLSCVPNKSTVGIDCLELLNGLACHISTDLISSWSEHLPCLKTQYTELCAPTAEPMALEKFQSSLKHFLECTIRAVNNETFTENIVISVKKDLERYDKHQPYKCFLMTLMGVGLKCLQSTTVTLAILEFLYNAVNHKSSADQESFATAVGMCASTKTSLVFSKIEGWLKVIDSVKRSILSLLKAQDSHLEEQTFRKVSIVQCLGYIAILAENDKVEEIVGGPVMLHLLNIITSNKIDIVNDTIMQTITKISRSLLKIPHMSLRQRPIIISHIVNTMKQDNISLSAFANCLQAMRDIVALQPVLGVEKRALVLKASIASCFSKIKVSSEDEIDPHLINCYCILNVLIRTVVLHDAQLATLDDIITLLRPSVDSASEVIRVKSMDLINSALCTYQQNLVVPTEGSFPHKSQFLAIIATRINDSCQKVKASAISCFKLIIMISDQYNGHTGDFTDFAYEVLEDLQQKVHYTDDETISINLKLVGDVICYKLSLVEIDSIIKDVLIGLKDKDTSAACGVAQIMSTVLNIRGQELQYFYPKTILEPMYRRLEKVCDPNVRFHTIEAICHYAKYKVTRFSNILATFPIPYEQGICETFQRMGGSTEMCVSLLTHFTQILERTPPYAMQNAADGERVKIANLLPLSVICAMTEIFKFNSVRNYGDEKGTLLKSVVTMNEVENTKKEIIETFASLFPLLILWYGSYVDCLSPLHQTSPIDAPPGFIPNRDATSVIPSRCVLECLYSYLGATGSCQGLEYTLDILLKVPEIETFDSFYGSIGDIVQDFAIYSANKVSSFVAYLDSHHTYEMQRITVACVFGTLISIHCNCDYGLLAIVISSLIGRLHDESVHVKRIAIRGLSTLDLRKLPENFEKSSEVLTTLVNATVLKNKSYIDLNEEVVVEALTAIATMIPNMKFMMLEPHVFFLFDTFDLFLEKPVELRDAATNLFLSLVISIENRVEYRHLILSRLIGILMHLMDPHIPVGLTCKRILLRLNSHFINENLRFQLKEHLSLTKTIVYIKFIEQVAPYLVEEMGTYIYTFVQSAIEFYTHSSSSIRKAAIILTSNLVKNSDGLDLSLVTRAAINLHPLLKDNNIDVACAAVLSLTLFKKYEMLL